MARRPLAVVQFGQHPDGPLPLIVNDAEGWGTTRPVPMQAITGEWPAFDGLDSDWLRSAGRISLGRLVAPPSVPVIGQVEATELRLAVPCPAVGRWETQLAADPSLDENALTQFGTSVILHAGICLTTPDGLHGVALLRSSLVAQVIAYTWDLEAGTHLAQQPTEGGDYKTVLAAAGLTLSIDWDATGAITFTAGGIPIGVAQHLPVPTTDLVPSVVVGRYGPYPDAFGPSWAALTEDLPLPTIITRSEPDGRPGWALLAATRDDQPVGEIGADTFTWTQRLGESDTLAWSREAPGGPTVRPGFTRAHLYFDGRRMFAGVVGSRTRSHSEDGALPRQWQSKDRRGQLDTRVVYPTHRQTFTDVALRLVLEQLLGDTQHLPGGDMGIRVHPDMPDGPTITMTVSPRDPIGSCIAKAVELAGGEWDIDRRDQLRWWPDKQGAQRDFLVDAGGAALSIDETTDPSDTGTALWVTGADSSTAVYRQHPDIEALGRTDLVISDPGEPHGPALAARADRLVVTRTVLQGAYTATLRPDLWTPGRLGKGDIAHVLDPSLDLDDWLRVFEIAVTVTGDNGVDVKATFGAPPPSFLRRLANQGRAIARLERT